MPAITEPAGFAASAVTLAVCCAYSVVTGLLLAEVSFNVMAQQGAGDVSIVTAVKATLGPRSLLPISVLYIFHSYCLLVAYIARAGEILGSALSLPLSVAAPLFAIGAAGMCYGLTSKQLDAANGALVLGIVASFVALLSLVVPHVEWQALGKANWAAVPGTIPVIALAFVYQNVVPIVVKDLEGDVSKVRSALVLGSGLPLVMFLTWEVACLGAWGTLSSYANAEAAAVGGAGIIDPVKALGALSAAVGPLVDAFSLLAIVTSYIGFVLALSDFLIDAMANVWGGSSSDDRAGALLASGAWRRPASYALTVLPPLAFALSGPDIFYSALDIAGTYGVLTMFGMMPAAMTWAQRTGNLGGVRVVPGGLPMVAGVGLAAGAIILYELVQAVQGTGVLG